MVNLKTIALCAVIAAIPGPGMAQSALDPAVVPENAARLRPEILKDYSAARNQSTYTLAVGAGGRGWGSSDSTKRTPEDRVRHALQKCEHYAHGPCILLMQDNAPTGETTPRPQALQYPTTFNLADVPFVRDESRSRIENSFAAESFHRVLALHRNGPWGAVGGRTSVEDATEAALARCQEAAEGARCFVYAVDDRVVFSPQTNLRPE